MMPVMKEWISLMEDYENQKTFMDRMKQQMEEDIAEVKAARENEKKSSRKREMTMQSICVATDKRKRLQITKSMVR